jgi:licheninase
MSFAFRRAAYVALAATTVAAGVITADAVSTSRLQPRAMAEPDNGNCPNTAAAAFGWGTPNRIDDFSDPGSLGSWGVYDSPGHNGNGRRTPKAMSVSNGVLTITGDSAGNSGGMAWMPGQMYGRWEVCAKSPSRIAMYLDGNVWWETTDTTQFPPGPMHLCIQLDNFGGDIGQGGQTLVDWTRQYSA